MATYKGKVAIFGTRPVRPIINIPADALKVKLRLRKDRWATAFVRFADRVERYYVVPADDTTMGCPEWKLQGPIDANVRPK